MFETCETIMYVPYMCQQKQIQTTTFLTASNVQPEIQRYAFVYVNIVHMEVDDAKNKVKSKTPFVLIYF